MPSSFPALDPCPDEPEEDSGRDDGDRETDQGEAESLKICHVEPPFDRPLRALTSPPRAAPGSPGRGPAGLSLSVSAIAPPGACRSRRRPDDPRDRPRMPRTCREPTTEPTM